MKNLFKNYLKKIFSDLHSTILGIFVTAFILSVGGIWVFSKKIWDILKNFMSSPTPLWMTMTFFLLTLFAYILLKKKTSNQLSIPDPEYREEFHVYWDKDYKMRCLNCGKPLKSSSDDDPSKFFCSDKRCDSKHILKDKQGKKITEQQAIELMKNVIKGSRGVKSS